MSRIESKLHISFDELTEMIERKFNCKIAGLSFKKEVTCELISKENGGT